MFNVLVILRYS
uniref:Uncharacterized protein n=1 Tax=Anguilla anguilla TaxID=7936 RepID=A0A0E9PIS7_ANGAN